MSISKIFKVYCHTGQWSKDLKLRKVRFERRKAKVNPESVPTYGRYKGWS